MFLFVFFFICATADIFYFAVCNVFVIRHLQHLLPFGITQEFAFFIKEFKRIPLFWVMACRKDDTTVGSFHCYCQFRCRGGCQTDIYYVTATSYKCAGNYIVYHFTGDSCISAYYYFASLFVTILL